MNPSASEATAAMIGDDAFDGEETRHGFSDMESEKSVAEPDEIDNDAISIFVDEEEMKDSDGIISSSDDDDDEDGDDKPVRRHKYRPYERQRAREKSPADHQQSSLERDQPEKPTRHTVDNEHVRRETHQFSRRVPYEWSESEESPKEQQQQSKGRKRPPVVLRLTFASSNDGYTLTDGKLWHTTGVVSQESWTEDIFDALRYITNDVCCYQPEDNCPEYRIVVYVSDDVTMRRMNDVILWYRDLFKCSISLRKLCPEFPDGYHRDVALSMIQKIML